MGSGRTVISPDGARWQVRRKWLDRPLPEVRRKLRRNRTVGAGDVFEGLWALDAVESLLPALAVAGMVILVVLVLLPLLGVALELIAVLLLLGWGTFGRVALRRPWIVEARNLDDSARSLSYAVPGWRRSAEAIEKLRDQIAVAGPPERI